MKSPFSVRSKPRASLWFKLDSLRLISKPRASVSRFHFGSANMENDESQASSIRLTTIATPLLVTALHAVWFSFVLEES